MLARIECWTAPARVDGVRVAPDFAAIAPSARLQATLRDNLRHGAVVAAAVADDLLVGYATALPSAIARAIRSLICRWSAASWR